MLLRQSRTTHPLVSPVMCVTACVGKYHVLFNYKCILSTVVDVRGMVRLPVLFEVDVLIQLFAPKTWYFNATCQVVYIQLSQDTLPSQQACGTSFFFLLFLSCWKLFKSNIDGSCVFLCCKNTVVEQHKHTATWIY